MLNQNIYFTTDVLVFSGTKENLEILLIERKYPPYQGCWAIPGGFLEDDEEIEDGARRELEEETCVIVTDIHLIGNYGKVGRDSRFRTITAAYYSYFENKPDAKAADDAKNVNWFSINKLPEIAFDHDEIIQDAIRLISDNI